MTHLEDAFECDIPELEAPNGTLLAFKRFSWRVMCQVAPQLTEIDAASSHPHPCELVELLDSTCVAPLVPGQQTAWPLWFVKLPYSLWRYAHRLAMRFPDAVNRESDDLLYRHTYYCSLVVPCAGEADPTKSEFSVLDEGVGYVFFSGFVTSSVNAACERGGINILLKAGSTAVLASYAVNEDELLGLQAAGDSSGPNWRPYRVHDEKKMAAVASLGAGGDDYVLGTLPAEQHSCAVQPFTFDSRKVARV